MYEMASAMPNPSLPNWYLRILPRLFRLLNPGINRFITRLLNMRSEERLLRRRLRPYRVQNTVMQRLQTFLGQCAFEMRDARVLNRGEDLLDSIC